MCVNIKSHIEHTSNPNPCCPSIPELHVLMYINIKSHTKHTSNPYPNPYVLANQTLTPFSTISDGDNDMEKLRDNETEKMTDNETGKNYRNRD